MSKEIKGQIFLAHRRYNFQLLDGPLSEAQEMAEHFAKKGEDMLVRFFAYQPDGTVRFLTSFSVLGGVVREHADVSIPSAHW